MSIHFSNKKSASSFCLFLMFSTYTMAQSEYRIVQNEAFGVGEELKWRIYYDSWIANITAGFGEVYVLDSENDFNGRDVYHIDAKGYSKGLFNLFFKVRDKFDSYIDKEYLAPHYFKRQTREGGYKKDDEYHFNQTENYVKSLTDSVITPTYIQDFISAVYYTRTINSDTLEYGDIINISFFLDDSVYSSAIVFEGREIIEIKLGSFHCLRFKPGMAAGEVFTNKYPMTLWVTDDKNHIPILAESAVVVGNIRAELMEFNGLNNPFSSLIELKE